MAEGGRTRSCLRIGTLALLAVGAALTGAASATGERELSFAAVADIGMTADASTTLKAIGAAKPGFLLALGDLSYAGPRSAHRWCRFVKARVGPVHVQLVAGNHEDDAGRDGRIGDFTRCLPDRVHSTGDYGAQYFFDYKQPAPAEPPSTTSTRRTRKPGTSPRRWAGTSSHGKASCRWASLGLA